MNVSVVNARWQCSMSPGALDDVSQYQLCEPTHGPARPLTRNPKSELIRARPTKRGLSTQTPTTCSPSAHSLSYFKIHCWTTCSLDFEQATHAMTCPALPSVVPCTVTNILAYSYYFLNSQDLCILFPEIFLCRRTFLTARHWGWNRVTNRTLSCFSWICRELLVSKCLDTFIIYLIILTILALQNVYHST